MKWIVANGLGNAGTGLWRLAGLCAICFSSSALTAQLNQSLQISAIDFYGAQGQDLSATVKALPIHIGQSIDQDHIQETLETIRTSVLVTFGKTTTDIHLVCCDQPNQWDMYIGIPGRSYAPLQHKPVPSGSITLPHEGLALYQEADAAIKAAVQSGKAGEDDSAGYALSNDPAAHASQLKLRAYALEHGDLIRQVLNESRDPQQRSASAELLGYAKRSPDQVRALSMAANDDDDGVRNDATRALGVMAASGSLDGLDATPFVQMLLSGTWTDRNKAAFLLLRLTMRPNPALLERLRREAMDPLIDGARWHSPSHASSFLIILGRIAGLQEKDLADMVHEGKSEEIIQAAVKTTGGKVYTQGRDE